MNGSCAACSYTFSLLTDIGSRDYHNVIVSNLFELRFLKQKKLKRLYRNKNTQVLMTYNLNDSNFVLHIIIIIEEPPS